ncbi:hypothetical protein N9J52_02195 [Flavobacteriales bacterium]|nr:hypothetical protein [Flavobacteriales bacterium]
MTLRKQDSHAENAVAQFLDQFFYQKYVRNQIRYSDLETQLKGVDVTFDFEEQIQLLVDEKAAAHFVNKNIPTFAFELDFIGIDGKLKEGWLFDEKKETQFYLLSWIQATKAKNFSCDDISQLEVLLIERLKIIGLLKKFGIDRNRVKEISKGLRTKNQFGPSFKNSSTPFYFYFTEHLTERPINIVIRKSALIRLGTLHKFITR